MKHTQGNWIVVDNGYYLEVRGEQFLKPNINIHPFMPENCISDDYCDEDETLANAKLIAAAPDLLEACMNLENDDNSIPEHAWNKIKAAIKKATI